MKRRLLSISALLLFALSAWAQTGRQSNAAPGRRDPYVSGSRHHHKNGKKKFKHHKRHDHRDNNYRRHPR